MGLICLLLSFAGASPDACDAELSRAQISRSMEQLLDWRPPPVAPPVDPADTARPAPEPAEDLPEWEI